MPCLGVESVALDQPLDPELTSERCRRQARELIEIERLGWREGASENPKHAPATTKAVIDGAAWLRDMACV
jgi:hypothetical protein